MENFIFSLEAIIPMFLMISLGILIRKTKLLNKEEIGKVNRLVFRIFLPLSMFKNIYEADLKSAISHELILFVLIGIFCVYGLSYAIVFPLEKEKITRGAMIHAIYRTNFVILGLPIVTHLVGGANIGITCIMIAIVVPIYNVLAVITLEAFRGGKADIKEVLLGIAKNPLIIAGVVGILALLLKIRLPEILVTTVDSLAGIGTPLAIVILGASFEFGKVAQDRRNLSIIVISRLLLMPAIALFAAYKMGFSGIEFATILGIFAPSTAVSSYTMAQQMGSNESLACNGVIFTTLFSCISLFIWIFIYKNIGAF